MCLLVALALNAYLFQTASRGMANSLKEILAHDLATAKK